MTYIVTPFPQCLTLMALRYPSVGSLDPSHTMGLPVPDMSFSRIDALTT